LSSPATPVFSINKIDRHDITSACTSYVMVAWFGEKTSIVAFSVNIIVLLKKNTGGVKQL
jgi:hypothetical protein